MKTNPVSGRVSMDTTGIFLPARLVSAHRAGDELYLRYRIGERTA